MATDAQADYEQTYDTFWREIVEKDGVLSLDQVKRELHDYHTLMGNAMRVYCHVTNDQISKLNTDPSVVISVHDEVVSEACRRAVEDEEGRARSGTGVSDVHLSGNSGPGNSYHLYGTGTVPGLVSDAPEK